MACSNISKRADCLMGRSENDEPHRICLAVSGWLLIITGVAPRLNDMSIFAFNEAAMAARFL